MDFTDYNATISDFLRFYSGIIKNMLDICGG